MSKLDLNQNVYPYTKDYVIAGIHHICPLEKDLFDSGVETNLPTLLNNFAFFLLKEREVYINPTSTTAKYMTVIKRAAKAISDNGFFDFEEE